MESALWAEPLQLPSPVNSGTFVQVQPVSLEGISAQATLTAGEWPGPPHHGGPVPVALPTAAASRLHLTLGSVLTGAPYAGGAQTSLQLTGLFRPRDPASPYWALDLLPVSGISVQGYSIGAGGLAAGVSGTTVTYGPAVANPAAFGGARGRAVRFGVDGAPAAAPGCGHREPGNGRTPEPQPADRSPAPPAHRATPAPTATVHEAAAKAGPTRADSEDLESQSA